jgi:hypothetical protein
MSVPPGAVTPISTKVRSRRMVAIAALVIGGVVLLQQWVLSEHDPAAPIAADSPPLAADPSPAARGIVNDPAPVQKPLEGVAATPPSSLPSVSEPTPGEESAPRRAEAAPALGGEAAPHAAASPNARASLRPEPPVPSPSAKRPRVAEAAPTPSPALPAKPVPELKRAETAGTSTPPPSPLPAEPNPTTAPSQGTQTGSATEAAPASEGVTRPAPSAPAAKPIAPAQVEPAPAKPDAPAQDEPAPAPKPAFDKAAAEEQMRVAAFKAATCGELGPTRGRGQVTVKVESWGRVVRVTHLNQSFVGTPVGLCVMQAFQQVHVPAFDGTAQTLTGSFVVE